MTATMERPSAAVLPEGRPATFGDAVRSEWTKLRSVRSTYWTLLAGAALGIGLGALISSLSAGRYHSDPAVHIDWDPVRRSLASLTLTQLAFVVLGVLVVSGEYSSGMIRTSLTAVPRRMRLMSAKLLVLTVVALVAGEVISFATFGLGQALIRGQAPSASLHGHLVLRAVIGAGLYLTAIALLSAVVAVIFRHAAAAIAVMVGVIFILPGVAAALPESWSQPLEKWWPLGVVDTNAGTQITMVHRVSHTLSAWAGFGWLLGVTAIVLAVSFTLLQRRDA